MEFLHGQQESSVMQEYYSKDIKKLAAQRVHLYFLRHKNTSIKYRTKETEQKVDKLIINALCRHQYLFQ